MPLKLTQALQMLGTQMEVALTGELSDVLPPEYMERTREAVHRALVEARRSWENQTLVEVFGSARAETIRSRIHELVLD
jgi:hypothetical protein